MQADEVWPENDKNVPLQSMHQSYCKACRLETFVRVIRVLV